MSFWNWLLGREEPKKKLRRHPANAGRQAVGNTGQRDTTGDDGSFLILNSGLPSDSHSRHHDHSGHVDHGSHHDTGGFSGFDSGGDSGGSGGGDGGGGGGGD